MIEFTVIGPDDEEVKMTFEHSLRSLSKWESKYRKAFQTNDPKSPNEMLDYYQAMLVTPDIDPNYVFLLSPEDLETLTEYINKPQTASSVPKSQEKKFNPETTTSELIYFMMGQLKINWEAQDWHLSRLMMLIEITSYKLQPAKKRPAAQAWEEFKAINDARKKRYRTNG